MSNTCGVCFLCTLLCPDECMAKFTVREVLDEGTGLSLPLVAQSWGLAAYHDCLLTASLFDPVWAPSRPCSRVWALMMAPAMDPRPMMSPTVTLCNNPNNLNNPHNRRQPALREVQEPSSQHHQNTWSKKSLEPSQYHQAV